MVSRQGARFSLAALSVVTADNQTIVLWFGKPYQRIRTTGTLHDLVQRTRLVMNGKLVFNDASGCVPADNFESRVGFVL